MLRVLILLVSVVAGGSQSVLPAVLEIINDEGQFAFTDGSSLYRFFEDGSFLMEPIGISGRAIEGFWKSTDQGVMEITGLWTWYNGVSSINDYRKMVIFITILSMDEIELDMPWQESDTRLYDVYFTTEELGPVEMAE